MYIALLVQAGTGQGLSGVDSAVITNFLGSFALVRHLDALSPAVQSSCCACVSPPGAPKMRSPFAVFGAGICNRCFRVHVRQ